MALDKCRTCRSNIDTFVSIFTDESVNNEIILIAQMILLCTNIKVRYKIEFELKIHLHIGLIKVDKVLKLYWQINKK